MKPEPMPPGAVAGLKARLPKSDWTSYFQIDLGPLAMNLTRSGESGSVTATGTDPLLNVDTGKPWLVIGEPGSGKTTVLSSASLRAVDQGRWVFFLPMASYEPTRELDEQLLGPDSSRENLERSLESGRAAIVIDAIDEARLEEIDDLFQMLLSWARDKAQVGNCIILSCRTAEVPPWVHTQVDEARMLPVPESEIDRLFEEIRRREGRQAIEENPLRDLDAELRQLCRNPLLLMMTAYLYQSEGLSILQDLNSRASLYRYFFDELSRWDRRKRAPLPVERSLTPAVREAIFAYLGMRLHSSGRVYVREAELQRWIADALKEGVFHDFLVGGQLTATQIFEVIASTSPLNARVRGALGELEFGFIHQTFGDVFAAIALLADRSHLDRAEGFAREPSDRHWDVLIPLCGLLEGPERLTQRIGRMAVELTRQDLLLLAARCMRDRWDMPQSEADDLCMRILEAFKYWDAFDYRLIHALKYLELSRHFPRRLRRDSHRFIEKYADVVPDELISATTMELRRYLDSDDEATSINAAYTLGRRDFASEPELSDVVKALQVRAENAPDALHEQIVASLKDLGSPESREFLEAVCSSPAISTRSRAFALNGLGKIGDLRSVPVIVQYLLNHSNEYRDSASWSLQMLAKVARHSDVGLYAEIKKIYVDALRTETDDIEGIFAKGNIVYSLGTLGAQEYLPDIIAFMANEEDPYVIEDSVNAVGLLADGKQIKFLSGFLGAEDPIVRMKAGEALLRVAPQETLELVRRLKFDRSPIVRDVIRHRLSILDLTDDDGGWASLRQALASPDMRRDEVVVRLSTSDAARVEEMAETLLDQRVIATRPKMVNRGASCIAVFTPEAFEELKARVDEVS